MRMKGILALISALALVLCAGCGRQESGELSAVIFERGHGSMWGNQFYIELCATEVTLLRYIPEGASDPEEAEHIPVTPGQWQQITALLQDMTLEEEKPSLKERLFGASKLDGGEFRKLTLRRQSETGTTDILYRWPTDGSGEELERLLTGSWLP